MNDRFDGVGSASMQMLVKIWTGAVAYVALIAGAGLSITFNVVDVMEVRDLAVDQWDIVTAVAFPALVVLMVEMFVSRLWVGQGGAMQLLRWAGTLSIGAIAMRVSWTHGHDFLIKRLQAPDVANLAPIAVDLLAVMATALILSGRTVKRITPAAAQRPESAPEEREIYDTAADADLWARLEGQFDNSDAPISPAVPVVPGPLPQRVRKERPTDGAQERALGMLMEGLTIAHVASATEVSRATVQRIARALSAIKADRQADVSAERLRPALVDMIRRAVTR